MAKRKDEFTCCICGEAYSGLGNNPAPVKGDGECCDFCNSHIVLPRRVKEAKQWISHD
jgi:hypothetical protein